MNHPHFAHSYQLFYQGFVRKAFPPARAAGGGGLAARYRFAGIMVPAVLVAFFAAALGAGSAPLLGLAANFMFFTVGWHYAKQGYGILMLDAALKGVRLGSGERRRLLWNTHLAWVTNWLLVNDALGKEELWGFTYYFLRHPRPPPLRDGGAGWRSRPSRSGAISSAGGGRSARCRSTGSSPTWPRSTCG